LVAIFSVEVVDNCRHLRYPYQYKGVEGPPRTLGSMNGIHCWDMSKMYVVSLGGDSDTTPTEAPVPVSELRELQTEVLVRNDHTRNNGKTFLI